MVELESEDRHLNLTILEVNVRIRHKAEHEGVADVLHLDLQAEQVAEVEGGFHLRDVAVVVADLHGESEGADKEVVSHLEVQHLRIVHLQLNWIRGCASIPQHANLLERSQVILLLEEPLSRFRDFVLQYLDGVLEAFLKVAKSAFVVLGSEERLLGSWSWCKAARRFACQWAFRKPFGLVGGAPAWIFRSLILLIISDSANIRTT